MLARRELRQEHDAAVCEFECIAVRVLVSGIDLKEGRSPDIRCR